MPPVLLPAGGAPRWALNELGTALGFEPGLTFNRAELKLNAGDTLVFYTDGITEAFNTHDECYGSERLLSDAATMAEQAPGGLVETLLQKVRTFAEGAPQSDDIAILSLKIGSPGLSGPTKGVGS